MKILLSYSKRHFDPDQPASQQEHWGSSANILARALHEELSELGELTYIDAQTSNAEELGGQTFDLFVGVFSHFDKWRTLSRAKRSIFFAVNMHPSHRNQYLQDFRRKWELPQDAFCSWDMAPAKAIRRSLSNADAIIGVGNVAVLNSYLAAGVPKSKVKMINYAADGEAIEPLSRRQSGGRFLHVASEIGLRKGFDVVEEMALEAAKQPTFHLDLVGLPSNKYYEGRVQKLVEKLGPKCKYHGWIKSSSKEYAKLLRDNDFILFPSLEEGQAGSVLDAVRLGLIPILTPATGIDFSPLGWIDLEPESAPSRRSVMRDALALKEDELHRLKLKTVEYYQLMHEPWRHNLRQSLRLATEGSPYPKVDITLAIFNKEKTILPLVQRLHAAASAYPRSEIHIIFDGCKDRTEDIVRGYFLRHLEQAVTYDITPNIFEVKSNNLGLKQSDGAYAVILQDDNVIYDQNIFYEAVTFMDKAPAVAIVGGLAGVNYYPRGTKALKGSGQIANTPQEVYWRQDAETNPEFVNQIFEVDSCMRGPLFIRKSFLEAHGYLDETYAPLYQDDHDLAFRAHKFGFRVFCILMDVRNEMLTMARYDAKRAKFFDDIIKRNTDIFYNRWKPSTEKDYARFQRIKVEPHLRERRRNAILEMRRKALSLLHNPRKIKNLF